MALEENKHEHLNTLGIALCRNAQYDEAISVLERSLALSVDDGVSLDLLFLALAHAGKGDTKTAHDYYTKARAWYETRGRGLSATWRDEFSRLSTEVRTAIEP